jgi:hypothetical protein
MDDYDWLNQYDDVQAAKQNHICECQHRLGEHVPEVIGNCNFWTGFEPCGVPGCDCHHFRLANVLS